MIAETYINYFTVSMVSLQLHLCLNAFQKNVWYNQNHESESI